MCEHYQKNCILLCGCCNRLNDSSKCNKQYGCHRCHNNIEFENNIGKNRHQLDKTKVKLICTKCKTEQDISNKCISCDVEFGKYFCEKCILHDFVDKDQYHCDLCNICRVGKSKHVHCEKCKCCLLKEHVCKDELLNNTCSICLEDLFGSQITPIILKCNHVMHETCYNEYIKTNYICPICQKSLGDMSTYYKEMNKIIEATKMPVECENIMVKILCNDCNKKTETKLHYIAMKCSECGSYNTVII